MPFPYLCLAEGCLAWPSVFPRAVTDPLGTGLLFVLPRGLLPSASPRIRSPHPAAEVRPSPALVVAVPTSHAVTSRPTLLLLALLLARKEEEDGDLDFAWH